jgi:hypothetical protein
MGFYDCRCMVTGVSLKGADAALVLLQQAGDAFRPVALAVTGNYNRLGSIDDIKEDANTELILEYFLGKLRSGELAVDADYFEGRDGYPVEDVEQLLACFERNINDNPDAAVLGGRPVVFALIARTVWVALARAAGPVRTSGTALFRRLFPDGPAADIYRGSLTKVSRHLRELAAVSDFLDGRGLAWRPAESTGQDYADDMRQYLTEAKRIFNDSVVMLEALKNYEHEGRDLLQED